jgi:hypothetical protein
MYAWSCRHEHCDETTRDQSTSRNWGLNNFYLFEATCTIQVRAQAGGDLTRGRQPIVDGIRKKPRHESHAACSGRYSVTAAPSANGFGRAGALATRSRRMIPQRAFITGAETFRHLLPQVYDFCWLGRLTCWRCVVPGSEFLPAAFCLAPVPASA